LLRGKLSISACSKQ